MLNIEGKQIIRGTVELAGAKNSALRLLAATILTKSNVHLKNFPEKLLDVQIHLRMLEVLGKSVTVPQVDEVLIAEDSSLKPDLNWEGRSIRNTLLILGALTARLGRGSVPLPGGCKLGERKHDLHVYVLEKLGARIWIEDDRLCAEASGGLMGAEIHLAIRSTGATENAIIAGSLAQGITRIWNPHVRPEILDLIAFLRSMGVPIRVFGQEHIEVTGLTELNGTSHRVIPDNMEAITWLVAASITGGDIEIKNFPVGDMEVVLAHLKAAGANLFFGDDSAIVRGKGCYPIDIGTGPHPGINSDVQPILAVWAALARGESRIMDLRFPGRYGYADEMRKMGLDYKIQGDLLIISGKGGGLKAASVRALDLRAGAALALAALTANGVTTIADSWQIDRGYVGFADKLRKLGVRLEETKDSIK